MVSRSWWSSPYQHPGYLGSADYRVRHWGKIRVSRLYQLDLDELSTIVDGMLAVSLVL